MDMDEHAVYTLDATIEAFQHPSGVEMTPGDFNFEPFESFDMNNPFVDLELEMIDMVSPLLNTPFAPLPFEDLEQVDPRLTLQTHQESQDTAEFEHQRYLENTSELKQLLMTKPTQQFIPSPTSIERPKPPPEPSIRRRRTSSRESNSSRRKTTRQTSQKTQTESRCSSRPSRISSEAERPLRDKPLKFPPCFVCGGKASGLHYGVNSCEACKGFFRRYIIRNEQYKCAKDGQCQVVNRNRENCSGCRLKKCLDLGMSKENSKLGRYTLSRRTETIRKVNELKSNSPSESPHGGDNPKKPQSRTADPHFTDHTYFGSNGIPTDALTQSLNPPMVFPDTLTDELTAAMDQIRPYGPSILTEAQLQKVIKYNYDRYQAKIKLYGQMSSVPKDEYYKLLKDYGIDIDGRLGVLKQYVLEVQRVTGRYCGFAKKIPGFNKLSPRDQSNLLKASRVGVFIILMHEGYNPDYQVIISRNGKAYHLEEIADKCFSRQLFGALCAMYLRWQKLRLSQEEKALTMAITLTFSDRCKLENPCRLDDLQVSLTMLLRRHLDKVYNEAAVARFAKIIDCLTDMRLSSEMYLDEYKLLCDDKTVVENVPQLTELLVEEW